MFGRKKIAMVVAEFLGTFTLASAVLSMAGRTTFPFFAAVAAGLTLGLMVLVVGETSGAHINPAITVGLWTIRKVETMTALVYIVAQMLGGLVAWTLNEYLLDSPLKNVAGDKFVWRVLIAEAVGALIFSFGVAAAVYQRYVGLRKAATMGGSLTLGVLVATFASNGLLNPAVALGIQSWSFAYVAGPVLGALVGMTLYAQLFADRPVVAAKKAAAVAAKTRAAKKPAKKSAKRK